MPGQVSEQQLQVIRKIKKTHDNLVVTLGITIGLILCVYFFSFAALIDSSRPLALQFLMVTTVLLLAALIYVKRIAFLFTKLLLGRKADCKPVLMALALADLAKDEAALSRQLGQKLS